jgi:hypothetical protein
VHPVVLSIKLFKESRPLRMRAFIVLLGMLLWASVAAKTLDYRTLSDPAGEYDIAFCARPSPDSTGKPGHAFVAFSHKGVGGDRDFLALGHTVSAGTAVASAGWSYWGAPVPGRLKEERYTAIKQACLVVKVDRKDYDSGIARIVDPLAKLGLSRPGDIVFESYRLGAEDCIAFMVSVANLLKPKGLKVPDRGGAELPMNYMGRFIAAN